MRLNLLYILCCITVFTGCKKDKAIDDNSAFFGGEIVNPYSDYIILSKSRKIIDTIPLDKKNRFAYKIQDVDAGLYHFFDGREIQLVLIQPNDSLMLRLNTYDFDESLVYSGIGAKENNYLMDLFLLNEEELKNTLKLSQLDPKDFEEQLNTLRQEKLDKLKAFKQRNKTTPLFNLLAESNINYKHYSNKELYPIASYRDNEKVMFSNLPKDFYNYRRNIDYNNELLKDYVPYNSFLSFHINNLALQEHFKHSNDSEYNELSLDLNLDKLKLIDEKISNEYIKNRLLNNTMIRFINNSKKADEYGVLLESFKAKSTNKKHIARAQGLVDSYQRLKPGNKIPEIVLLNPDNEPLKLTRLVNKPTVVYFWTKNNKNHITTSHKRIKELNVKYPEVEFIAINIDSIPYTVQKKILNRFGLRIHNEYRLQSPKAAIELLSVKPINNVYIIDKHDKIVNAKANIFTIHFEQELLGVINQ